MFSKLFNKTENKARINPGQNAIKATKNWYTERYDNLIVQRNLLFLLVIISLIIVITSIFAVIKVSTSKTFDPFVIEIEKDTGAAKVVNPTSDKQLTGDESLARYFMSKYLRARETYNPADFDDMTKTVRIFSDRQVFRQYLGFIRDDLNNPILRYSNENSTFLNIKSWSKLSNNTDQNIRYMVRFSVHETTGARRVFHKIAVIEFKYNSMELSADEMDINPLGFQVISYRVDNDNS